MADEGTRRPSASSEGSTKPPSILTGASDEATAGTGYSARTPVHSPSVMSIKSLDSTVMQGNLEVSGYQRTSRTTAAKKVDASKEEAPEHSHLRDDQLPLPTPLDVSECPLFCCFYAEFDIRVGPKVCFQSPKHFMDQDMEIPIEKIHHILGEAFEGIRLGQGKPDIQPETLLSEASETSDDFLSIFDSCSEYIITGSELTGNLLNLSSHHMHVLTRPTILEDERYERNSLLFCVGFVLRRAGDPRLFRPILSKWAMTLRDMELETHYLSTRRTRPLLQSHLDRMLVSLNSASRECYLQLTNAHHLSLRLFHPPRSPPAPVPDHAVPVLLRRDWQFQMVSRTMALGCAQSFIVCSLASHWSQYDWDLAINWVICHVDGVRNARQISKIAEVDMEMVRACLRVLKHHGFVTLIDMFFFTNRYETLSSATQLLLQPDARLLTEAAAFCLRGNAPASHENSPSLNAGSPNDGGRSLLGGSFRLILPASMTTTTSNTDTVLQRVHRREDHSRVCLALGELYNACSRTESIGELWLAILSGQTLRQVGVNWKKLFSLIDHRRFTTFGVVHGILRRVHQYPLYQGELNELATGPSSTMLSNIGVPVFFGSDRFVRSNSTEGRYQRTVVLPRQVASLMDGQHCDDAIVCEMGKPLEDLVDLVGKEDVVSLYAASKAR